MKAWIKKQSTPPFEYFDSHNQWTCSFIFSTLILQNHNHLTQSVANSQQPCYETFNVLVWWWIALVPLAGDVTMTTTPPVCFTISCGLHFNPRFFPADSNFSSPQGHVHKDQTTSTNRKLSCEFPCKIKGGSNTQSSKQGHNVLIYNSRQEQRQNYTCQFVQSNLFWMQLDLIDDRRSASTGSYVQMQNELMQPCKQKVPVTMADFKVEPHYHRTQQHLEIALCFKIPQTLE